MPDDLNRSKLLAALDAMLDDESIDVDLMLFTSFEFAPDFFEQNILLKLDSSIDRLQQLEEIEHIEKKALDCGVAVFHDMGRLSQAAQKVVGIPTVPVAVDDGVFHPKVVVISGKSEGGERVVRLMVSSANLTQAGWGKNVEVSSCIEDVRTEAVARPLAAFLHYLRKEAAQHLDSSATDGRTVPERMEEVIEHLEGVPGSPSDDAEFPKLHITVPSADTSTHLLDYIANSTTGPVTLGSPYHYGLFDQLEAHFCDRDRAVAIALGRDANEKVEMEAESLEELRGRTERDNFNIKCLPWDSDDQPRRQHLKFIVHGGGTIVGSHNATSAALGSFGSGEDGEDVELVAPRNVEVSLEWPGTSILGALEPIDDNTLQPKDKVEPPEPIVKRGELLPRFSLVVDWSAKHIIYRPSDDTSPIDYTNFEIGFLGGSKTDGQKRIPLTAFEEHDERWQIELKRPEIDWRTLAETKKFFLYEIDAEQPRYVGFINERNRDKRTRFREPSPFRCLQVWCRQRDNKKVEPSDHAEPLEFAETNADREAFLVRASHAASGGALGNYFFIYRAAAQMLEFMEASGETNIEELATQARTVLEDGSGSIKHIVDYLEPDDTEAHDQQTNWLRQPLPKALLAAELDVVLDRVDEILEPEEAELIGDIRRRLREFSRPLRDKVSGTDSTQEFLWDALTNPRFFKPVRERAEKAKEEA